MWSEVFHSFLSIALELTILFIGISFLINLLMALMISSAGASLPELTLLNSIFKKKLVFAFVASVFTMSTISGFLFYII